MFYNKIQEYRNEIVRICEEIFKVYGYELQLKLEDYNLLSNDNNCIQSSTSVGYIIEEFLVSKLEIYTSSQSQGKYKITRSKGSTTNASYDCFSYIDKLLAMINIKAVKQTNNAISAINILYDDYVIKKPNTEKCFLILKIFYNYDISKRDKQRKIFIKNIESFFLDEIDFREEHEQDNRNWSKKYNPNSGRLQVSDIFRQNHKVPLEQISYQNTLQMLEAISLRNKAKQN